MAASSSSRAAPPDAGQDPGQDLTPTARALSDEALRHYQQGEYDAAIESFMGAYALSNNAGLLFNVAQAYRLKGDCEHARESYQRFLTAAPDTPLKPSVERRVAEMEACIKSRGPTAAPASSETARAAEAVAVTTTLPPPAASPPVLVSPKPGPSPSRQAAVLTLRGSALALLATSAVFGALTLKAYEDYRGAQTPQEEKDARGRYTTNSALAWTFVATGVACAVVSYFVGRHR